MFSTHDYFSKRLTFQNINSLSTSQLGTVYYPELISPENHPRTCTFELLKTIELIFIKSEELSIYNVNNLIDLWLHRTQIWKINGFSSIIIENMMNFLNKKSVVIDDSVFLISTLDSENQMQILSSLNNQNNGKSLKNQI